MIDVRDIMKSNYSACYELDREEWLEVKRKIFGEKELNAGLSQIVVGVPSIIENSLAYANSIDQFVLVIPKIRENIFNPEKQKAAQKITYFYRNIHDFINKDEKGIVEMIGRRTRISPNKMPEYIECMYEIAIDCINFCLEQFRQDIEDYRSTKRVTWAQEVERCEIIPSITKGEVQNAKRKVFEELKDNEGNRKDWRAKMRDKRSKISTESHI